MKIKTSIKENLSDLYHQIAMGHTVDIKRPSIECQGQKDRMKVS